jgi:hypothetical protein
MAADAQAAWIDAARSGVVNSLIALLPGLVAAGCSPDSATDKHGLTALHHAALRGHERACEHLLAVLGVRADVFSGAGSSPLVAQVQFPRERHTLNTFTPLHVASLQGNVRSAIPNPSKNAQRQQLFDCWRCRMPLIPYLRGRNALGYGNLNPLPKVRSTLWH